MKKIMFLITLPVILTLTRCGQKENQNESGGKVNFIRQETVGKAVKTLEDKYGTEAKERIGKGVQQVADLWVKEDGSAADFEAFCAASFAGTPGALDTLFNRLSEGFEVLFGNFNKMGLELKRPLDLDKGPVTPVDEMFGAYNAGAHLTDDLFQNKLAFVVCLNFPFYSLKEKTELGEKWDRKQWAYARMGDMFTSRVPAALILKSSEVLTGADTYISSYNICMGNLLTDDKRTLFPKEMKLISHWGIRDELKANYTKDGLEKQKMIYQVMKRIIFQEIPDTVINNPAVMWDPYTNKVTADGKEIQARPEPDKRYQVLLDNFHVMKAMDPWTPKYPTFIARSFEAGMEIPQEDVEKLFVSLLSSPRVKDVAALISKRLGRKLEPFDIWYDGFKPRNTIPEAELTKKVREKYPDIQAFQKDLSGILTRLGWDKKEADLVTSKIVVDPARGSGHAAGTAMKSDVSHLRTRFQKDGMDYKGYNIAVHEFGHNVEQTLDMQNIDHYMLSGVPNTAFTEALAFIFQKRDLELLGIRDNNPDKKYLATLDDFWSAYEIMGVALVDMNVWKWLYAHPDATAAQLKEAVIAAAKEIWNKYYAPVFGTRDEPILAIYSHMIDNPLYLPNYPLGHLIDFQIEKQIEGKKFASEIDRIFTTGRIIPELWMKAAVGREVSVEPMLEATDEALKAIR